MKHSPGPWGLNEKNEVFVRWGNKGGQYVVWHPDEKHDSNKANAKLMSIAPQMYEALRIIYKLHAEGKFSLSDENYSVITKIAALLAKTEGE